MSLLSTITKGRENRPPRLFVYGQEGVGKSLFSASAPNPIFVQTEDGLGEIDTAKFPLAKGVGDVLAALAAPGHACRALCGDQLPSPLAPLPGLQNL